MPAASTHFFIRWFMQQDDHNLQKSLKKADFGNYMSQAGLSIANLRGSIL